MTEQRATVREETSRVVRAVVRYVSTEYEPGSGMGRLSIHESRVSRKGGEADEIDLERASATEILDAIARAEIRRAVYAPPSRRLDVVHEDGEAKGKPLRCVAPRRLVAQVVKVKSSRHSSGGESGVRMWRLEMARCMGKLPRECQSALVEAVKIASARIELSNHLAAARSDVERLRGSSRKKASALRAAATERLRALETQDRESTRVLDELIRGNAHRYGMRRLEEIISGSADIERAIFPEAW